MTNYQKRKEKNDEYRNKIMRFTFQLSLGDTEVREWFEQQPEKGAYLKDLILRDKAERLGYREQKSAEPDKAGDYEIIQSISMGGRVLLTLLKMYPAGIKTLFPAHRWENCLPPPVTGASCPSRKCRRQKRAISQAAGRTTYSSVISMKRAVCSTPCIMPSGTTRKRGRTAHP